MKVAFWSNASEKCNVSANLAAISIACVARYPYSILLLENKLSNQNLGKALLFDPHIDFLREVGANYYDGGGIEGLLRKIYRGDYEPDLFWSYIKEIIQDRLYYIPQSKVIHSEIFEYEFAHCIHTLLEIIEEHTDICFIDTVSHNNLSTKTILEEADVIVVNLCQNQNILEDFFLNYSSLIPKAIFLISNYDPYVYPNSKRIANLYDLPWENIAVIPDNEAFYAAYKNGSVVEFFNTYSKCGKENRNYIFMQAVKKAAYLIIKKAVESIKEKETSMCSR